jgi:hypothetical protein
MFLPIVPFWPTLHALVAHYPYPANISPINRPVVGEHVPDSNAIFRDMKTHRYILTLATILVSACFPAAVGPAFGKTEAAMNRRNEIEQHWASQYASYSHSKRDETPRESTRLKIQDKDQVEPSQGRKREKSRPSYRSP